MPRRSISGDRAREGGGGLEALSVAVARSIDHHSLNLTVWPLPVDAHCSYGTITPAPSRRAVRLHAVGMPIPGHDVSGTGWQTLGRAMQSITTMVPVWQ
jgi:hypothetical protein